MKLVLALCLAPAAALVAPVAPAAAQTKMSETKADLEALQNSIPGPPGYWDPLDLAGSTILAQYGVDTVEANIGWFRHAEIKHGRVAMAAFLGFIAGCTPLVSGEHAVAPYRGYVAGGTPFEQWDNMPLLAKAQIFTAIGMLESYGEGAAAGPEYTHYMRGGQPGFYPDIKGKNNGQIGMNLYDPFGFGFRDKPADKRARGLKSEILNGRAAMFGIMGFLAESKVPGSVPILSKISGFPHYDGDVMAPFAPEIHLNF